MAKNIIKGLTVEIGGDTTKLGKALEDVNRKSSDLSSELGEINRLLKMDPGNTELLAQKQKVLADAVANTSDKLQKLKDAEQQVQKQFERGEVSEEQVRALRREIEATEQKLKGYKNAVKETADEVSNLGKTSEDTSSVLAGALSKGLKSVAALGAAAVAGLTAAAETTRDYRMEMGKLDTAFTQNGFSSDTATGAYKELVGVLGEYDQSVEAANHLAILTDNEKDLAHWTGDILPGVFATFGDSLPIEGLTEAANETAKVGQVTGPLADALNWAGVSEDAFNESLAKCNTEQERQALITKTLTDLYAGASEAYKTTNADVIAANQANDNWTQSLANVGEKMEPLLTAVKDVGATLLNMVVPVIDAISNNLPIIGVALAGITAALVAFKVAALAATAAQKGMTLGTYLLTAAQAALNVVLNANPVGLIILAITAVVVAIMALWKHVDAFREFFIGVWEGIKKAFGAIVKWFGSAFKAIGDAVTAAANGIKKAFNAVVTFFAQLPQRLWSALTSVLSRVKTWASNMISSALNVGTKFVSSVASAIAALPGRIASALASALSRVVRWGRDMVSAAASAMGKLVSSVVNTLKSLPGKVVSIGADLVKGLWKGISNSFNWLKKKIGGFASNVLKGIKGFFGVHSPAESRGSLKTTDYVGEMLDEGLANGLERGVDKPMEAARAVSRGVLDAASDIDGLTLERRVNTTFGQTSAVATAQTGLLGKLDQILGAIQRGQVLVLDGEALVGATADRYDSELGHKRTLTARGAL